MSELGDCQRRGGYRMGGYQPTNQGGSVQAVMGTVLHEAVASVLKDLQADGLIPADDLIEHEVFFAGIKGHLDRFEPGPGRLTDTKSTTSRWLDKLKVNGPTLSNVWQTHAYGAALMVEGHKVRTIAIDYIARDTGDEWRWEGPFETAHIRDALEWVNRVRSTHVEDLPREYAPDSPWCQHCPFFDLCWDGAIPGRDPRSALYVEDPDAAGWAEKLTDARDRKKAAEKDEATAKGALDALRPNDDSSAIVKVPGLDVALKFTVSYPKRIATTQIRQDYKAAGRPVPETKAIKPTVKLELIDAEEGGF
jgi:hypothetical protein